MQHESLSARSSKSLLEQQKSLKSLDSSKKSQRSDQTLQNDLRQDINKVMRGPIVIVSGDPLNPVFSNSDNYEI